MRELVIDLFAGGGGTSTGIERALGYSPDVAINHDRAALAMHAANHPDTIHLTSDVWAVDPHEVAKGRKVGFLWASPDCKHFSKAKGGKPVKRNIRDLAWVVVKWAAAVEPRIIMIENVEEFQDWGPLVADENGDEYPDPARKGLTFKRFVGRLRGLGYAVEWREIRASDFGAPTIRKRLFIIARRDGRPIEWPAITHGNPKLAAFDTRTMKPWRTAAEIIDWSLPCPSIFMTREEARAYYKATGIRVNRPLADATMARIARGVKRYVLDAGSPFIVPVTHAGDYRCNSLDEPLRTQTTAHRGEHALVTPFVTKFNGGSTGHRVDEPLHTITAAHSDHHPGGAAPLGLVTPFLVPRYGERPGQDPRCQPIDGPLSTIVPTGNGASIVAPVMVKSNFGDKPYYPVDEPVRTIVAGGNHHALVAAFLAQHNTDVVGHDARKPVSTIVGKGCTQGLVAAHMLNMKGADQRSGPIDQPAPSFTAQGNHAAVVAAFLMKYYGSGGQWQGMGEPLHTTRTKDGQALITVTIGGEPYVIIDIGMRMLTPRERFLAQGFPPDYRINIEFDGKPLSGEAQGRMVGNSVCPPVPEALIRANYLN